jgi:hypothetical protein
MEDEKFTVGKYNQPLSLLSGILVPSIAPRQNFQTYAIITRAWRRSLGKCSLRLLFVSMHSVIYMACYTNRIA